MQKTIVKCGSVELSFTDSDIVDIDDVSFANDYNPHNQRLWLLHDHGFTICVVQASSLQDALDAAVDADKLDRFKVNESDAADYDCDDIYNCDQLAYLGNASEPFDIETLGFAEIPLPSRSVVNLFGASVSSNSFRFA